MEIFILELCSYFFFSTIYLRKQFTSNPVWRNSPSTYYVASKQIIHMYFQSHDFFNELCDFFKIHMQMVYLLATQQVEGRFLQTELEENFIQPQRPSWQTLKTRQKYPRPEPYNWLSKDFICFHVCDASNQKKIKLSFYSLHLEHVFILVPMFYNILF